MSWFGIPGVEQQHRGRASCVSTTQQRKVTWTWHFPTSNIATEGSQARFIPSWIKRGVPLTHQVSLTPPVQRLIGTLARRKRIRENSPSLPGLGHPFPLRDPEEGGRSWQGRPSYRRQPDPGNVFVLVSTGISSFAKRHWAARRQ